MKSIGYFHIILILQIISSSYCQFRKYHLSDEFIKEINSKQSTWIAGRNFDENDFEKVKRISSGVLSKNRPKLPVVIHEDQDVPETFNSSIQWPNCQSLNIIRDQSNCGSCWAFSSVEAMSDRICIHSNQTLQTLVSAEDLLSCCSITCGDGCDGGWEPAAWAYWYTNGISTGGLYNRTDQGCRSYSFPPCEHHSDGDLPQCSTLDDYDTPICKNQCDLGVDSTYNDSLTFGQEPYSLAALPKQIQLDILKNGPVTAAYDVYADFPNYKSGVYQRTTDDYLGGHAVKIVGWGVENGVPYWTIANSWNYDWGDNGYFKILRGVNECGIESSINAGLPRL